MKINHNALLCLVVALSLHNVSFANNLAISDEHAQQLLDLSMKTELAKAQKAAAEAQLEAKNAREKLSKPQALPETARETISKPNQPSALDTIKLKSLVTANGISTAWISLSGELIEVRKGSHFGAITVLDLTDESILLTDGERQKRRWIAGATATVSKGE